MELLRKWNRISLVKRIIAGLLVGTALGILLPQASFIGVLGTLFVGALKALAPLLVFFLVMHSLAQHKKGAKSNMSMVIRFICWVPFSLPCARWSPAFCSPLP